MPQQLIFVATMKSGNPENETIFLEDDKRKKIKLRQKHLDCYQHPERSHYANVTPHKKEEEEEEDSFYLPFLIQILKPILIF